MIVLSGDQMDVLLTDLRLHVPESLQVSAPCTLADNNYTSTVRYSTILPF